MIRSIPASFRSDLLRQPETGMGWQAVTAVWKDGTSERLIALNARHLADGWAEVRQLALQSRAFEMDMESKAADAPRRELLTLRVERPVQVVHEAKAVGAGPASAAPEKPTKAGEEFRRFSAYENDLRVTDDKGLRPGTYATTAADAARVRTGMDAVRRYALPNPAPAKYEFEIRPPGDTTIKEGTSQPANEQPGGGVEVIFVNGSPSGTVRRGRTLSDK